VTGNTGIDALHQEIAREQTDATDPLVQLLGQTTQNAH
jgi:hypothetical protein